MKTFKNLANELHLERFLGSKLGTMYFQPDLPPDLDQIVRHFDSELSSSYTEVYEALYNEIVSWIKDRPEVSYFIEIQELLEVGADYVIRAFQIYDVSIADYFDKEEPVELPVDYVKMKNTVLNQMTENVNDKEKLIQHIIKNSVTKSTKSFYDDELNKFVIVEPSISVDDVKNWNSLI